MKRSRRPSKGTLDAVVRKSKKVVSPGNSKAAPPKRPKTCGEEKVLFELPRDDCVTGVLLRRPSAKNRSPYVADVKLVDGKEVIAHAPSLELGGKCIPQATLVLQRARDKKGNAVTEEDKGKFGTPKCQYITRLCEVQEQEAEKYSPDGKVWVGAHPSIGESIASKLLAPGETYATLHSSPIVRVKTQVRNFAGTRSRLDFMVWFQDGKRCAVEVKTVVDTDYDPSISQPKERMFLAQLDGNQRYSRAAIFPFGRSKQKGPDGEDVVSSRAIEHIDLLRDVATNKKTHHDDEDEKDGYSAKVNLGAAVLFIVVREDADFFRPNYQACPSFAKHLKAASESGVKVLAHKVRWGREPEKFATAFCAGALPVHFELD